VLARVRLPLCVGRQYVFVCALSCSGVRVQISQTKFDHVPPPFLTQYPQALLNSSQMYHDANKHFKDFVSFFRRVHLDFFFG